ncbi:sorbosone dehydrogenase family protein [Saccharospirillum sp.]|uniref:sorbosone dehydrogenase family protein n=1 Tax=Saccharospirillum sp. TaxID=2033801 RepID=UPI0034A06042
MKQCANIQMLSIALLGAATLSASAIADDTRRFPELSTSTIMTGLDNPWDMAFLQDGTLFYTEKCRGLSVRLPDGAVNALLGMKDQDGYASSGDDLFCEGQAGMQGVAVDPDFNSNRLLYVYATSDKTAPGSNRVLRMTVNEDFTDVANRTDIIEDIPYKPEASDHPFGGPGAHNGGRIRFSPGDGYLYVTTGDTHNGEVPQSGTLLGGKVLRVDGDGNAAPFNNNNRGFDPRIFTFGHRNVQGITFDPVTHQPVISEHGPWHSDEITALVAGGNGGWDPRANVNGRGDCPDNYCGYSPNQMEGVPAASRASFMPMTDFSAYPDALPPAWNNNGLSQGTSSAEFLKGHQWGAWNGRLVTGVMGIGFGGTPDGQRLDVLDLADDNRSVKSVWKMPIDIRARFRSVVQGPDGNLYTAVDQGEIYQIRPN